MTEKQFTDLASSCARTDERTKAILEKLEDGEEIFEAHARRIGMIEKRQEKHESQWLILKWISGLLTTLGLGFIANWISTKH